MSFTRCQTSVNGGGGLQVKGNLSAHAGNMTFQSCKAGGDGGGVDAWENVRVGANARLTFDKCMAGENGGGWGSQNVILPCLGALTLKASAMPDRYVLVSRQLTPAWCKYSFLRL